MTTAAERRKRIRVPVQSKIRHSQYQVLGTPIFQENSSIDLSSTGIAFETAREYKEGNLVLLEVQIDEEPLKLLVCVAWVKPKSIAGVYEVGAELIAVDPVHKRKMQSHLNHLITEVQKKKRAMKAKLAPQKKTKAASKKVAKKTAKKKIAKKKIAPSKKRSKKAARKKS